MSSEIVAIDGDMAVVRVDVGYSPTQGNASTATSG